MAVRWRTRILTLAGASWLARAWARIRCRASDVRIRKLGNTVELRKGKQTILLAPKHIFWALEVCSAFELFACGLPAKELNGQSIVDFAAQPGIFNLCRVCVANEVVLEHRGTEIWLRKGDRVMVLALRHLVYSWSLAKSFDLYFAPMVPEEREGLQVLDYSQPGRVQTYAKSGLQFEMASFPEEEDAIDEVLALVA